MLALFKAFFRKNEKAALSEDKAALNHFNSWFHSRERGSFSGEILTFSAN